jgi:hypothetical protein
VEKNRALTLMNNQISAMLEKNNDSLAKSGMKEKDNKC